MDCSIWLDSLSDSEAVFLGSLVILGGFVAMGQRVKNTIDVCDLPYNRHTAWEKEYDMVRLVRASECEVNGVDICLS